MPFGSMDAFGTFFQLLLAYRQFQISTYLITTIKYF